MESTDGYSAAPIFVVGSPRSGTSILTWCLGQHPNILPLEESDWMGPLTVDLGARYAIGSARGARSQLAAVVAREDFFRSFGAAINRLILDHRKSLEENNRLTAQSDPGQVSPEFSVSRGDDEPKARWVDGTPEHSLYICGLNALFPAAKFVHIVRDVGDVASSMRNFRHEDGSPLVHSEHEAFDYWMRTVQACVAAEQALGRERVCRIRYVDLIQRTQASVRKVLEFLGEPFSPACLQPLAKRINSSDSQRAPWQPGASASSDLIARAVQLSEQLQQDTAARAPSPTARAQFEAEFAGRVQFARELDASYAVAQEIVQRLQGELTQRSVRLGRMVNWCGVLLAVQLLSAIFVYLNIGASAAGWPSRMWLTIGVLGAIVYAWLRRVGLHALLKRVLG